jgi:Iap family predicted aminopeptidase
MIEHCHTCGSFDIKQYDSYGYKCNFCNHVNIYNQEGHSYQKEDIFNKIINVRIEYKKNKNRYIVLNGKALKKYKTNELESMRNDYTRILTKKSDYLQGSLSYEEFIEFLSKEYNQFGVNFFTIDNNVKLLRVSMEENKSLIYYPIIFRVSMIILQSR